MEKKNDKLEKAHATHNGTLLVLYMLTAFFISFTIAGLAEVYEFCSDREMGFILMMFLGLSVISLLWMTYGTINEMFKAANAKHNEVLKQIHKDVTLL